MYNIEKVEKWEVTNYVENKWFVIYFQNDPTKADPINANKNNAALIQTDYGRQGKNECGIFCLHLFNGPINTGSLKASPKIAPA